MDHCAFCSGWKVLLFEGLKVWWEPMMFEGRSVLKTHLTSQHVAISHAI
jgi:hypothetical protein